MPPSNLIVIANIAMMCLALGIIIFVILYQRRVINHQIEMREFNRQKEIELMQAAIQGEEEERMRIAAELHDDVGATLSAAVLYLHKAEKISVSNDIIVQAKDLLNQSIQKVRDLSHQLQPGTLQYLGLTKALQSFAETIARAGAIRVRFIFEAEEQWQEPDSRTALSVYRIIQELVNNIIKHAQATTLDIAAYHDDEKNCISVTHDGAGLTEGEYHQLLFKKGAIGLKNIENRLKSAGLSLIFPEPCAGNYKMILCMPHAENPSSA